MRPVSCFLLLSILLVSTGCPQTQVDVTATLVGNKAERSVSMSHGVALTDSPSIVFASETLAAGRVDQIDISVSRSGAATATGYEAVAIMNRFGVGGGGLFNGTASAGNRGLLFANTGTVAKTAYYFFEDQGNASSFPVVNPDATATRFFLARVKRDAQQFARVPFIDTTGAAANFLGLGCLTGGDDPCFDISTLANTLFTALSGAVGASVGGSLTLGGTGADGDFRLDYLPALQVRRGCGSSPSIDPGIGFIFGATIDAPLGIQTRIHIPVAFSALSAGNAIDARVHPFADLGGCQEMQFIDAITVSTTTFLGVGAQAIADMVQTNIVCALFGPDVGDFDCTDIDPSPLPELMTAGLAGMMANTLTFHWREAYGNAPVPQNIGLYLRPRNADNTLTTTDVTPANAQNVQLDLVITQ